MLTTNPNAHTNGNHILPMQSARLSQDSRYKISHEFGNTISNELAEQWHELARRISSPVFIHDLNWFKAQLHSQRGAAQACHILSLSYNDQVIAIFPLQYTVTRHFGLPLRTWRIFWPNDMGINDFIIPATSHSHHYLQLLMTHLNSQAKDYPWDLLELENVLHTSSIAAAIKQHAFSRCLSVYHHNSKYLRCGPSYESSTAGITTKFKKNTRRKRKNLEKLGAVTTSYYSAPNELADAFEQFLDVEAANWKGRQGTALRYDAEQRRFYQALINEYADTGRCAIHTLYLDGVPVASQFALISGDTFYLLKIGYDAQYQATSPGVLLLDETIKRFSGHDQIRHISFVTGAKWNDDWAPQMDKVYHHYIYNASALALFCRLVEKIKSGLRQIKHQRVKRASEP